MIKKTDMKVVDLTPEEETVASFLAIRRGLFEYPRGGYGDYNTRGPSIIKNGLLGELAFFNLAYQHLVNKYSKLEADERNRILQGKFLYKIVIGDYDAGFEFKINGKTIDIKTYATEYVAFDDIYDRPLNLFIDAKQNACANIYVQAFILKDTRICISGYHIGLPPLATWMPNQAYTCRVPDLLPISELLEEL